MLEEGRYYIGDLHYIINDNDWNEYFSAYAFEAQGEITIEERNNERIACYVAPFGDGIYTDVDRGRYPVDSGTIGCFPFTAFSPDDINGVHLARLVEQGCGRVVTFENKFEVSRDEWNINFGHISISQGDTHNAY